MTPLPVPALIFTAAFLFSTLAQAEPAGKPSVDAAPAPVLTDPIARIRDEGLNCSEVMATLGHLTDVTGPRLTGSPQLRRASEWTRDRLTAWGMVNSQLEPWGPFGRGWSLRRFSAQVIAPQSIPLIAFPKAWSPGVGSKPLEAEVVHVDISKPEHFERYRGKLRGRIVLDGPAREIKVNFEPLASRRSETNLLALANSDGATSPSRSPAANNLASPEQRAALALLPRRYQFYAEEGVAVILQPSAIGEAGALFATGAIVYPPRDPKAEKSTPPAGKESPASEKKKGASPTPPLRGVQPWKIDAPPITPQIVVATEQYNRLVRMSAAGERLRASIELQSAYHSADLMSANVVAEIPGSDPGGELVMLGAHLDSWHTATGATDNAAGSAVALEAMRILRALELKPRRTIRIALWTGEEQGLLGSKAYVAAHFGELKAPGGVEVIKKPEHEKLSAYFNLDNGAGKIRGIYLQNNEAARSIFRQWLKPFKDFGAETISLNSAFSTDHLSFDAVGLPGFQFIQDDLEYQTRTHHGIADLYDRVVANDLKEAAVIMATVVYEAAMADEKLPRKPLQAPAKTVPSVASGK